MKSFNNKKVGEAGRVQLTPDATISQSYEARRLLASLRATQKRKKIIGVEMAKPVQAKVRMSGPRVSLY
jgi:hypothetical protein